MRERALYFRCGSFAVSLQFSQKWEVVSRNVWTVNFGWRTRHMVELEQFMILLVLSVHIIDALGCCKYYVIRSIYSNAMEPKCILCNRVLCPMYFECSKNTLPMVHISISISVWVYLCICGFIKCSMRDANNTRHATQFIRCERASGVATVFTNRKVFLEMVSTFLRTNYGKSSVIDWNIERSQIEYFIEFNKKFNYSLFPEWSGNNTHTQTEKKN